MFHNLIASSVGGETILTWIEFAALCIEVLAVAIIVVTIVHAMTHYLLQLCCFPVEA